MEERLSNYSTLEDKIYFLELKERQRYNYYCDCGCNFSREADVAFHEVWDWIICKIKELKQEKEKMMLDIRIEGYDEYVKDFGEKRINTDIPIASEEQILEFVKENCRKNGVEDIEGLEEFGHTLEKEYSTDGQEHRFYFVFEIDDDGQGVMRYKGEEQ